MTNGDVFLLNYFTPDSRQCIPGKDAAALVLGLMLSAVLTLSLSSSSSSSTSVSTPGMLPPPSLSFAASSSIPSSASSNRSAGSTWSFCTKQSHHRQFVHSLISNTTVHYMTRPSAQHRIYSIFAHITCPELKMTSVNQSQCKLPTWG